MRAIVQDAHLNFLIGAGTSSQLFAPLGDVELALTEIDRQTPDVDVRQLARASVQGLFFDSVIWPNTELLAGSAGTAVFDSYTAFGRALKRLLLARRSTLLPKRATLFTSNVDLAVEVAFEELGLALNDGFEGRFRPTFDSASFGGLREQTSLRYGHRSDVPVFDLVKLHGSVGWQWSSDDPELSAIVFDRDLRLVHEAKAALEAVRHELIPLGGPADLDVPTILDEAQQSSLPAALPKFIAAYDAQVIVNPEKTKFATTVLTETYYELIRRFANELERETTVLFVHGFSFRDEHLRSLVLRAARTNPTLQVFVFCFSQADEGAYHQLIPPVAVPNGNIEYLAPPSPDERFTLDAVVANVLAPIVDGSGQSTEASDGS